MGVVARFGFKPSERWEDIGIFFKTHPAAMEELCSHADVDPEYKFEELTVKGMLEAVRGDIPEEWDKRAMGGTVIQYGAMVNALREGLAEFQKFMEATIPPLTIEQKKMARGTLPGNMEEAVMLTLKTSFTLQGLEAAQNLTVYEYEVARKEAYNEAVVIYNKEMEYAAMAAAARTRR